MANNQLALFGNANRHNRIGALIEVAQELGITEESVRYAIQQAGGHVSSAANQLGQHVSNAYHTLMHNTMHAARFYGREAQQNERMGINHPAIENIRSRFTEGSGSNILALSNSPHQENMDHAQKRKRSEEHGMESVEHGNTPATGTGQAGYIEKFVPRNFQDKQTYKLRYVNTLTLRSAATAGTQAVPAYLLFRTNSMNGVLSATAGTFAGLTDTHPNQFFNNWKTLYGYYRVEEFKYKIHCSNLSNVQFTETATPAFTNNIAVSDAIVTLLPTQTTSDITATQQKSQWEQKESKNCYLQSRSPGSVKSYHTFHGAINPEDYDIDPLATAADETWTLAANTPATNKYLAIIVQPALAYTTTALLPEVGVQIFVEFDITVQFAGYLPSLRQTTA